MQNVPNRGARDQIDGRNDRYRAIVRDLVSLIAHVRTSARLIEAALVTESANDGPEPVTNIIILDDVTPCYSQANAALNACQANLVVALGALQGIRTSRHETTASTGDDSRSLQSSGRV